MQVTKTLCFGIYYHAAIRAISELMQLIAYL